ncbi:MAG: hypothetical protein M0D57_20220 [Sphingobacteriales bacterium JAD_PAG50586_3]|nr:MAG: hypothetical protein M0D57_20220 [Sphingobacteriales bacterium JAD_PAG50586_3]
MKLFIYILLLLNATSIYGQFNKKITQYNYFDLGYVEDPLFSNIHSLQKVITENGIAEKMYKQIENIGDGPVVGYFSWKPKDDWQDNIPQNDFIGIAITQTHTAYPAAVLNYRWNSFGYDLSSDYAYNLIVCAEEVDDKEYGTLLNKIKKVNKLLNITLLPDEEQALKTRKNFINSNGNYTYIFHNVGIYNQYTNNSFTYSVVPKIKVRTEVRKAGKLLEDKDIRKDTIGIYSPGVTKPFCNPDSLKQLLIDNHFIPQEPLTVYPMYYSLAKNDSSFFSYLGFFSSRKELPANSFMLTVFPTYYQVSKIQIDIKNPSNPDKAQIQNNLTKLTTLYKILGIEVNKDLGMYLKNAAATDEVTPNLTITSGGTQTQIIINSANQSAKLTINAPNTASSRSFKPYKP